MDNVYWIIIAIVGLVCIIGLSQLGKSDVVTEEMTNLDDQAHAAKLMNEVSRRIAKFAVYLKQNIGSFPDYTVGIDKFYTRIFGNPRLKITERSPPGQTPQTLTWFRTYGTVGQSAQNMVVSTELCMRNIGTYTLQDVNTLMYVMLHEMAHVAAFPDQGHSLEFCKYFMFFVQQAPKIGVYKAVDYRYKPVMYCGMQIGEHYANPQDCYNHLSKLDPK